MTPFTRAFTPTPADIDELGHVNNAVWVRWIQDMATSHWQAVALPEHIAVYYWVVMRHEIDYRGNVGPGESVTGRTWIESLPKGAQFDRRDKIMNTYARHLDAESQRHVASAPRRLANRRRFFQTPLFPARLADKGSALAIRSYNYRNPADPARHDPTCKKWPALQ